jgi:hypothetical protein
VVGSLACAAAVAAYPPVAASRLPWVHAGISIAAFGVLAAGLVLRRTQFLVWSLALLGANYAIWLALGTHALDQRIPVVGVGLLLVAELAFDSLEPEVGRVDVTTVLSRAIVLVVVALGAVGAGTLVLAVASIPLSGGVAVTAVGALAAVLILALITRLAAERR